VNFVENFSDTIYYFDENSTNEYYLFEYMEERLRPTSDLNART